MVVVVVVVMVVVVVVVGGWQKGLEVMATYITYF